MALHGQDDMKGLPGQGPMQRRKWLRVVGRFDSLHRLALCGELRVPGVRAAIFASRCLFWIHLFLLLSPTKHTHLHAHTTNGGGVAHLDKLSCCPEIDQLINLVVTLIMVQLCQVMLSWRGSITFGSRHH